MPGMVVKDYDLIADREASFRASKKKFLLSGFTQEIALKFDDLMEVFKESVASGASGLRVYFIQEPNKPGTISLLFAPTIPDPTHPGWHIDQAASYKVIKEDFNEAKLVSIVDPSNLLQNYRADFKSKSDADALMSANNRKETVSLFYEKDSVLHLYDAIRTGCLKGIVTGVGIKFVAYKSKEQVPRPDNSKMDVDNQLLFHFVFYDCENKPMDFVSCYGVSFSGGDADTGLPCPDFCNGGDGLGKKPKKHK